MDNDDLDNDPDVVAGMERLRETESEVIEFPMVAAGNNAPSPVTINRNTDEIRAGIRDSLTKQGEAHVDVHDIRISLEEWRKLARAAGRELGRPVETIASDQKAWATLRDWPSNPREKQILDAAMRRTAQGTGFAPLE